MKIWKKFTKEAAVEAKKAFIKNKEIIEKASSNDGRFEVVMSTNARDRSGEIVLQEGIDTRNYEKNPVVLFAHNYYDLPIGRVEEIIKESDKTIAKGVFVSKEINPKAQQIRKLYDAGIMKAVSIGFIPLEYEGNVITKSELLELSFVPVPANPEALAVAKEKGLEKEFNSLIKNSQESKELIAIKKTTEVLKELVNRFRYIEKRIEELDKKMVVNSYQVTKGKAPKGEVDIDLVEFLQDTNSATQLISRIADNINKKFNKLK